MRGRGNSLVPRKAFTLIEVLIALTISTAAMTLVWMTFATTAKATERGEKMLESLHQGEYIMDMLVSAMKSACYFPQNPELFEFQLEDEGSDSEPSDIVSWVTSSASFMPVGSPLTYGIHRIYLSMEEADGGEMGLAVTAHSHLIDPESDEADDVDPWIVSTKVQGFECRVYDHEQDSWEDEWEEGRSMPRFVEFRLVMKPTEEEGDPSEIIKVVDVPLAIYTLLKPPAQAQAEAEQEAQEAAEGVEGGNPIDPGSGQPIPSVPPPTGAPFGGGSPGAPPGFSPGGTPSNYQNNRNTGVGR